MSKERIINFVEALEIAESQRYKNLALFPLLGPDSEDGYDYIILDEAIGNNLIEVLEKGEEGTVAEVLVRNNSDKRVLMLDGEELIGAKQNRILNTSIIVAARSETIVPVSCTEAGRWHYTSRKFGVSPSPGYARLRRAKSEDVLLSLEAKGKFESDQGRIWEDVEERMAALKVASPTGAMYEAYESCEDRLNDYLSSFNAIDRQVGILYAINGEIIGADVFDKHSTLEKLFDKLLRSYALDAIAELKEKASQLEKEDSGRFLSKLREARFKGYKSPGEGYDHRIEGSDIVGSGLTVDGRVIHLALFKRMEGKKGGRMSSPSRRRRFR